MDTVYYTMTYGEYKKHTGRLRNCVGHSLDETLTDNSKLIVKVTDADHVHHYLETQTGVLSIPHTHQDVVDLATHHPVMRHRGGV
jgi:hypothetical protein